MSLPESATACPESAPNLGQHPDAVVQRIIRQFLEAALFEGLAPYRCSHKRPAHWQWLRFRLGAVEGQCRGRVRGFGRIHLDIASLSLSRDGRPLPVALTPLVNALPAAANERESLLQALTLTAHNTRRCRPHPDRRGLTAEALDSALHEGHPYHPCFKARTGFSDDDQQRFGPEAGRRFRLHWLAVPRSQRTLALPQTEDAFWQQELGRETAFLLRAAFHRTGTDWQSHGAIPVHPWQWRHIERSGLNPAINCNDVRYLGPLGDYYRASQSLRSLFNVSRPGQACVKVPLAIGNTSSQRHLEPHSVPSAPVVSAWLSQTVANDPRLSEAYPLRLLAEYASVRYDGSPDHPGEQLAMAGHLGAIWRTGISQQLEQGEQAVPMNALFATEADGQPFIRPWLACYGVQPWLTALIHTVVLPVWHLLLAHGIAVEAHAQNSLVVFRDGWPVALMLRDFHDSVEYVSDFLAQPDHSPRFGERQLLYDQAVDDRYYRMAQVDALRELVMDTLFVFNLSELALLMDARAGIPENQFWHQVRRCLDGHARAHPELDDRCRRLAPWQPRMTTESLLTRHLRGPGAAECHHRIPNALAHASDPAAAGH